MINLLHIPEGVRDIYGSEGVLRAKINSVIKDTFNKYGYHDVVTPSFEYFDIFNKERGTVSSKDMYKFFDREGNTLVLRPDITPTMARVAAKYYKDCSLPVRLCYMSRQYINHSSLQGKLKETTCLGVELYNDDSVYADFELIALTIESIKACGVKDFQLEIGDAGFLQGLIEASLLSEEKIEELMEFLEQKNIFALEDFVNNNEMKGKLKFIISRLAELYGGEEILNETLKLDLNEKSKNSLLRLIKLNELLVKYGYANHISFDLSMLSKYSYYTGVFFRAITYGSGEPIAYGGRYNNLVKQFGFDVPAIGMAITVDYLMLSLEREHLLEEKVNNCKAIFYNDDNACKAHEKAISLRMNGENVRMIYDNDGSKLAAIKIDNNSNKFARELDTFDVCEIVELED